MFTRRTALFGVLALALLAAAVTAGKKPPPPPPPTPPDPAILYEGPGDQTNEGGIWVMNADGTNRTPVITVTEDGIGHGQGCYSWSGDNTRFVFDGRDVSGTRGIYVSDVAGLYPRRIYTLPYSGVGRGWSKPDWAPTPLQGQPAGEEWIVFGEGSNDDLPWQLLAIALRADGTTRGPFNLTYGLDGDRSRTHPSVSFDGTFVVYQDDGYEDGRGDIYIGTIGTDGFGNPVITDETCLTSGLVGGGWWPAVDPTGAYVVANSIGGLWIVPINNPAGAWPLLAEPSRTDFSLPAWVDERTVIYEYHQIKPMINDLRTIDVVTKKITILADGRRPAPRRHWHD